MGKRVRGHVPVGMTRGRAGKPRDRAFWKARAGEQRVSLPNLLRGEKGKQKGILKQNRAARLYGGLAA